MPLKPGQLKKETVLGINCVILIRDNVQCRDKDAKWFRAVGDENRTAMMAQAERLSTDMERDVKMSHLIPEHLCWEELDRRFIYTYRMNVTRITNKRDYDEMENMTVAERLGLVQSGNESENEE